MQSGAPWYATVPIGRGARELALSLHFCHVGKQWRVCSLQGQEEASGCESTFTLTLHFSAPRTVRNKCLLFKPLGLWCDFSTAKLTKTPWLWRGHVVPPWWARNLCAQLDSPPATSSGGLKPKHCFLRDQLPGDHAARICSGGKRGRKANKTKNR